MTPTGSASFRDPENAAFLVDGTWYRIALPASAAGAAHPALRPTSTPTLVGEGSLVSFDEVGGDRRARVLEEYARAVRAGRCPTSAVVFAVEPVDVITYPWEWPNSLLESAALLTLDLRRRLLGIGLDLKDASAFNVQFRGMRPVFIDLGSVERWRPNPSWNASRQFIEHFINPLAVGSGDRVTAADAWELGRHRGLRSEAARQLLPKGRRRSLSLLLLQATTRPVEKNAPSESKYADEASRNKDLARNATLSLTKRLAQAGGASCTAGSTAPPGSTTARAGTTAATTSPASRTWRPRSSPAPRVATGWCSTWAATTASPRRTSCGTPAPASSSWTPTRARSTSCTRGSPRWPRSPTA